MAWRKLHVFVGYLLIGALVSHANGALPDSGLGWSLLMAFILITASGLFGTYLRWSIKARGRIDEGMTFDRMADAREQLAQKARALALDGPADAHEPDLPDLPHDAWIRDLYATELEPYFQRAPSLSANALRSGLSRKRVTAAIDSLSSYVSPSRRETLDRFKGLVAEKHKLDGACVTLWLSRVWLLVHVPFSYALVVLAVVHVIAAYSFSSGTW